MEKRKLSLGIDTSNYKTSVAVVSDDGEILFNSQAFLYVKEGERGLRQSEALFQHVNKLPQTIAAALANRDIRKNIGCVAVSDRPRPAENSYMPVFNAGVSAAEILSASLAVPLYKFSHQEGHIEAVRRYSTLKDEDSFVCFHFSGGTTEAIAVDKKLGRFEIVGGSKDISYVQVLDRIGVAMGFSFPCGKKLDELAGRAAGEKNCVFTPIKVKDCFVNLSGIETQGQRLLEKQILEKHTLENHIREKIACDLMLRISESIEEMTLRLAEKYDIENFIFAGGVSSSEYLRKYMNRHLAGKVKFVFGDPKLSQDNAVGTALLGGSKIWL